MALQDLTTKIIKDAEHERDALLDRARQRVREIEEATALELTTMKKANETETEIILENNKKKVIAAAEREAKMKIEIIKRQLLDEVFTTVLIKLSTLSDKDYKDVLVRLLGRLPSKINSHTVVVPKERLEVSQQALKDVGFEQLKIVVGDIEDGLVVVGDDQEYDLTFSRFLEQVRDQKEIEVANTLFGSEA